VQTISEALGLLERLEEIRSRPGMMRSIQRAIAAADSEDSRAAEGTESADLNQFLNRNLLEVIGEHRIRRDVQQPAELVVGGMIEIGA